MEQVSLESFRKKVRGVDDLYDATIRNGYFLPARSLTFVTEEYLT